MPNTAERNQNRKSRIDHRGAEYTEIFYLKLALCVLSASAVIYPETCVGREKFQL